MQAKRRARLLMEQLERRDCPSLSFSYSLGSLTISGSPRFAGTGGTAAQQQLSIVRTAGTIYTITDTNGTNSGSLSFSITRNLQLNMTSYQNANITINLNNNAATNPLGGNITLNLGRGNTNPADSVTIEGGATTGQAGKINGSVTIQGGSGEETINIGGTDPANPTLLTVGGSVSFSNSFQTGFLGNTFNVNDGTRVGVDVLATQASTVAVGSLAPTNGTTIGRNLTINDSNASAGAFVDIAASILGNVSLTGTNVGDFFTISSTAAVIGGSVSATFGGGSNNVSVDTGATILGSFTINAGAGSNAVNISAPAAATNTIGGSVSITLGGGNNTVATESIVGGSPSRIGGNMTVNVGGGSNAISLVGTIAGSATVTTGAGSNTISTTDTPNNLAGTISNNLTLNLGNGTNVVTLGTSALPGSIGGSLTVNGGTGTETLSIAAPINGSAFFNMNNGTNSVTVTGTVNGSTFNYTGGTVSDSLVIDNGTNNPYNLTVTFKAGTRSLQLGPAAGNDGTTFSGNISIDFGTGTGTKAYTNNASSSGSFTINNYP